MGDHSFEIEVGAHKISYFVKWWRSVCVAKKNEANKKKWIERRVS
jgi:hypothetical protein